MDPQGNCCEDIEEVAGVAVDYFNNMFSTGSCNRIEECLEAVQQKVTIEMQQTLSRDFSANEVKAAMFQMRPTKAPGLDGRMPFFTKSSSILLVIMLCLLFLNSLILVICFLI